MNKKATVELLKSIGRAIWFALLAVILTALSSVVLDQNLLSLVWTVGSLTVPVGVWVAAGLGFLIKAIDRYIHENKEIKSEGIALPFLQK